MAGPVAPLSTPSPPVIMLPGHTTERETSITVECHHHAFNLVTATLDGDPSEPLFRVEAKLGTSWSWRRRVYAESPEEQQQRRHLFDFRHASVDPKNRWLVEAADDKRQLAELVHQKQITSLGHSDIDATVRTAAGEDVVVSMQRAAGDEGGEDVTVSVDGAPFARIDKVAYTPPTGVVGYVVGEKAKGPSSVWKVTAAAGVDLALVMVMALCRAEMYHVWKK
ncbi:hypothetical protein Daus18300_014280 [Diaporthe australafricana]|uniref:Uncharacterized protein n=1 Tax=Diaporthe australafricana TaxID=127596 RepID=A0ABR3VVY3_9PEZI